MRRLVIIEILNILIIPVLFNVFLVLFCPDGYRDKSEFESVGLSEEQAKVATYVNIIAYTEEYLIRFIA